MPIPATPAVDPAHLEDAEIAAVLIAINDGEIQEAELATTRGKSDDVKTFASHMLKAHKSMLDDSNKAFLRAKLTPSANAVSDQLNADIKDEVLNLQTRQGQAFDEAYIDDQLKAHEKALSLIDEMAPNAKDTNLQANCVPIARRSRSIRRRCRKWSDPFSPATRTCKAPPLSDGSVDGAKRYSVVHCHGGRALSHSVACESRVKPRR